MLISIDINVYATDTKITPYVNNNYHGSRSNIYGSIVVCGDLEIAYSKYKMDYCSYKEMYVGFYSDRSLYFIECEYESLRIECADNHTYSMWYKSNVHVETSMCFSRNEYIITVEDIRDRVFDISNKLEEFLGHNKLPLKTEVVDIKLAFGVDFPSCICR